MAQAVYTPEWMPLKEVAARLACDNKTVLTRIRHGDLPVRMIKLKRVIRINRADFEEALHQLAIASSA